MKILKHPNPFDTLPDSWILTPKEAFRVLTLLTSGQVQWASFIEEFHMLAVERTQLNTLYSSPRCLSTLPSLTDLIPFCFSRSPLTILFSQFSFIHIHPGVLLTIFFHVSGDPSQLRVSLIQSVCVDFYLPLSPFSSTTCFPPCERYHWTSVNDSDPTAGTIYRSSQYRRHHNRGMTSQMKLSFHFYFG